MVLNSILIDKIKLKSGLSFEKTKDLDILCDSIFKETKRSIGITTIKRLIGYIEDDRNANEYTLNTIAIYLGFQSWQQLNSSIRIDSEWGFDEDSIYINSLEMGDKIEIRYLNRTLVFEVVQHEAIKALKVLTSVNSSLQPNDILIVYRIKKGEILEAKEVYRGNIIGNYRTNGEIKSINLIK